MTKEDKEKFEYRVGATATERSQWEADIANVGYATLIRLARGSHLNAEDSDTSLNAALALVHLAGHGGKGF